MENFFRTLQKTGIPNFQISISFNGEKGLVSIIPKDPKTDSAFDSIKPFTVSGTIEELDKNFLNTVNEPIKSSAEFFSSSKEYLEGLKKAEEKTQKAKNLKEKKKTKLDELKKFTKDKDFNPLKDFEKAIELANAVIEIDPECKEAKKVLSDMKQYEQPTFKFGE